MTAREMLNRRYQRAMIALIAVVISLRVAEWAKPRRVSPDEWLVAFCVAVFALAGYLWLTPCPQCRKRLGWMAVFWRPRQNANTSRSCPHCGISIDQDASIGG